MLIVTRAVRFPEMTPVLGRGERGHGAGGSFNKVIPTRRIPSEGSNLFTGFCSLRRECPCTDSLPLLRRELFAVLLVINFCSGDRT